MKISDCKHYPKKEAEPKAKECQECGQKFSLRACLECGHVGCCDSSPGIHARKHAQETGHQTMASLPLDQNSFYWCYEDNEYLEK